VRLQAKSTDSEEIKSVESVDPTNDGSPSFAEIASHPPDPSAPVLPNSENEKPDAPRGSPGSRSTPVKHQQRGAIPLLAAVYRERGFFGWYQGLTAQVLKAVLCQGRCHLLLAPVASAAQVGDMLADV